MGPKPTTGLQAGSSLGPLRIKNLGGHQQYEAWNTWVFQFNNYIVAANLEEEAEERKIAILLHLLGADVVPIYMAFKIKESEKSKLTLKQLIKQFEDYFSPKRKVSIERYKFLSRKQGDESIEEYVTDLKNLSSTCDLGTLESSLTKDCFIVGISDSSIREVLLQQPDDKTLDEIVDLARTVQMSKEKGNQPADPAPDAEILRIQKSNYGSQNQRGGPSQYSQSQYSQAKCQRCGSVHNSKKCSAFYANCNKCNQMGHFAKMCRSNKTFNRKPVNFVQEEDVSDENSSDEFFIGKIFSDNSA